MTPDQKAYFKQHLQYVRNTGGCVSVPIFDDDWEPIGPKLREDLRVAGLINIRGTSITLTESGETALVDGS